MADLLAEGKFLEEAVRAVAAKAAKDAIESFARSELSAHLGYEKGGKRASALVKRKWTMPCPFF